MVRRLAPGRRHRGHATVDFGGQWFTGRLLLEGKGRYLYERHAQWEVMREHFPQEDVPYTPLRQDELRLGDWLRGKTWGKWKDRRAAELLALAFLPIVHHSVSPASRALSASAATRPWYW